MIKKNRLPLCRYGSYLLGGFTEDSVVPLSLSGLQLALIWAWPVFLYGAHKLNWVFHLWMQL